jgi:hypothetical protein
MVVILKRNLAFIKYCCVIGKLIAEMRIVPDAIIGFAIA